MALGLLWWWIAGSVLIVAAGTTPIAALSPGDPLRRWVGIIFALVLIGYVVLALKAARSRWKSYREELTLQDVNTGGRCRKHRPGIASTADHRKRPAEKSPVVIGGVMATSTVVGRFRWCSLDWNGPPNPGGGPPSLPEFVSTRSARSRIRFGSGLLERRSRTTNSG